MNTVPATTKGSGGALAPGAHVELVQLRHRVRQLEHRSRQIDDRIERSQRDRRVLDAATAIVDAEYRVLGEAGAL